MAKVKDVSKWKGGVFAESYSDFFQEAMTSSYFFRDEESSVFVIADPWLISEEIKMKLQCLIDSGEIEWAEEKIREEGSPDKEPEH